MNEIGMGGRGIAEVIRHRPLGVICGFLGAGKTTWLKGVLAGLREIGVSMDVVLNDYENAELDAERLRVGGQEVRAMAAACACCDGMDGLLKAMVEMRGGSGCLVELNGTADPVPLLESLTLLERAVGLRPRWVLVVVDARHFQLREIGNVVERLQVEVASFYGISHVDEVSAERLEEVRRRLREINPHAQEVGLGGLVEEMAGMVAAAGVGVRVGGESVGVVRRGREESHGFTGCQIVLPGRYHRRDLECWLRGLPGEVLRVKALVDVVGGDGVRYLYERVGGEVVKEPLEVGINLRVASAAVMIGPRLDEERLLAWTREVLGTLPQLAGHE